MFEGVCLVRNRPEKCHARVVRKSYIDDGKVRVTCYIEPLTSLIGFFSMWPAYHYIKPGFLDLKGNCKTTIEGEKMITTVERRIL